MIQGSPSVDELFMMNVITPYMSPILMQTFTKTSILMNSFSLTHDLMCYRFHGTTTCHSYATSCFVAAEIISD